MPTWTFVRHGQSLANLEGWYAGQTDAPLTDLGRQQAHAARADVPSPPPPRAFCSDLQRAHHTAKIILEGHDIPLVVVPALRERFCGAWERRSADGLRSDPQHLERLGTWRGHPPGGESLFDVALRVAAWAAGVDDSDEDTLIVAHGALMCAVLAGIDDLPREQLGVQRPRNCEAISRTIERGGWAQLLDRLRAEASQRPSPSTAADS